MYALQISSRQQVLLLLTESLLEHVISVPFIPRSEMRLSTWHASVAPVLPLLILTQVSLAAFVPSSVLKLVEGDERHVIYSTNSSDICFLSPSNVISAYVSDPAVATVITATPISIPGTLDTCLLNVTVRGRNLGYANARIQVSTKNDDEMVVMRSEEELIVSVVRQQRVVDTVFMASVVLLVSISYVNMGCTLDWAVVKATMRRPVGPVVGLCCQYLFMPLVGYGLCLWLMDGTALKLSLFVVACCPGGGASNFWTILLRGNLNLSITMTFVSSLAAFATMPAWIFTLGRTLFDEQVIIPYQTIAILIVGLVIPCGIGLALQRFAPKVAKVLSSKLLRPVAVIFVIYILTVGTYTNLYIMRLITWKLVTASMVLTWSGFAFGAIIAKFFQFPLEDIVAISIETGVQNSGIAIVMLKMAFEQPGADMTLRKQGPPPKSKLFYHQQKRPLYV
ncbi:unnamed protein product [Notodromas monacha]|uniref:Solute carrier family 10 member 6 n=1 Tax=Notodromas monacha TaxID=399045 RepID=A0A7R9BZ65_9CRUS|nr:unnamed protein product [Notodromas monacha]CAG0924036.1 unnamed protein product [Notodromas monacha]